VTVVTCGSPGIPNVRATAVLAGFRTDSPVNIDLSVPIWTIEHVAAAFHLSVDAAREYTYRPDFPRPRDGFARNLWTRQEVLDWFAGLPPKPRGRATVSTATVARTASRPADSRRAPAPAGSRSPAAFASSPTEDGSGVGVGLFWGHRPRVPRARQHVGGHLPALTTDRRAPNAAGPRPEASIWWATSRPL
jgi:hypothetical protein